MWTGRFMPPQGSSLAGQVDMLYLFLVGVSIFFSALIAGLIIYFAFRYKRRRGSDVGVPIHGSTPLEILWSAVPLVIMLAIPLGLIGIAPGFWLLNLVAGRTVGGYSDPVWFTATAMIGMIALAGIVVRNSIILVDFVRHRLAEGVPLREAVLESGVSRLRPIVLTAGAAMLGAWPITLDPIFSGLAWSLVFGVLASTAFTLVVIPVAYYALYRGRKPAAAPEE